MTSFKFCSHNRFCWFLVSRVWKVAMRHFESTLSEAILIASSVSFFQNISSLMKQIEICLDQLVLYFIVYYLDVLYRGMSIWGQKKVPIKQRLSYESLTCVPSVPAKIVGWNVSAIGRFNFNVMSPIKMSLNFHVWNYLERLLKALIGDRWNGTWLSFKSVLITSGKSYPLTCH